MSGILPKLGIILVAVFIAVTWVVFPVLQQSVACHTSLEDSREQLNFRSTAYGWSQEQQCDRKFHIISTFDECQNAINVEPEFFTPYIQEPVAMVMEIVKPLHKNIPAMKVAHDTECRNYPQTLFEVAR